MKSNIIFSSINVKYLSNEAPSILKSLKIYCL